MKLETAAAPEWIHFGAGNIFRGYIACLADDLLGKGLMKSGIIAVDVFNTEPIEKIFDPFDDLALLVGLKADGGRYLRVIGSVAEACAAVGEGFERGYVDAIHALFQGPFPGVAGEFVDDARECRESLSRAGR